MADTQEQQPAPAAPAAPAPAAAAPVAPTQPAAPAAAAEGQPQTPAPQQQQQQQGGEQSGGGEEKKKPPSQPLTENPMLWALGAGILGLLFSGGGGIGAFLLAGVMALVAAFAGPKLMRHFSGDHENQLPTLAALDTQDGKEADKKFKAKLLDKNNDDIIDKSEQAGVAASDRASLKAALEAAATSEGSGITSIDGKFKYTNANTELTLTAAAPTTPAPTTGPAATHGTAPSRP